MLLRALRTSPVTEAYPDVVPVIDRGPRGTPVLDAESCTAAGACASACPTGAISLAATEDAPSTWQIDYGACVFCGACSAACPDGAIRVTTKFELAGRRRADLIVRATVVRR